MKKLSTVIALVLLVSSLFLPVNLARAEGHPLIEAIDTVFQRSQSGDLKEYGLDSSQYSPGDYSHSIKGCWLKKGENKIYTPNLDPDVEYAVIAGGDSAATKIKIRILNPGTRKVARANDPVITESTEDNNAPGAVFRLKRRQAVGIQVTLEEVDPNYSKDSAYVAFLLLRKDAGWDVPMENLRTAALKLEKRLDKVREANGGSADLMYGWFSIHGGVIPKGMRSGNLHTVKSGGKYIVIVASDDASDALDVSLEGPIRGTKPAETVDESPKVTYRRGQPVNYNAPFNAQHFIKNKGDISIVLLAIVQLIEGS